MLPTLRRGAILAELRQAQAVSAEDLAQRFGVSSETIRRDLRGLRDRGLLERVYGGALSVRSTEDTFAARSTLHRERKLAIARLAAGMIEPEDTIVIDVGTTALEVARALPESFFAEFYADKAFLGSGGVHARAGLTDYHPPEVVTRRTIIAHAAASYVLADSSKLGAIAVHRVCPLDRVTAVLTDHQASPKVTEALADAGCTVLVGANP